MFHSDLSLISDEILEIKIHDAEEKLSLLYELKKRRKSSVIHRENGYVKKDGHIIEVTCKCGEATKFKVPLNTLTDFKCPKDK